MRHETIASNSVSVAKMLLITKRTIHVGKSAKLATTAAQWRKLQKLCTKRGMQGEYKTVVICSTNCPTVPVWSELFLLILRKSNLSINLSNDKLAGRHTRTPRYTLTHTETLTHTLPRSAVNMYCRNRSSNWRMASQYERRLQPRKLTARFTRSNSRIEGQEKVQKVAVKNRKMPTEKIPRKKKKKNNRNPKRNFAVNFHFCTQRAEKQWQQIAKGRGDKMFGYCRKEQLPHLPHSCNISLSVILVGQRGSEREGEK